MSTKPKPVHRCKCHNRTYTVCPACECEYCPLLWIGCPRTFWHPNHDTDDQERGKRQRILAEARREAEALQLRDARDAGK